MGYILKFILIFIAISWIFSKLLQFFVKSKLKQFVERSQDLQREEIRRKKQNKEGVVVDHIPDDFQQKRAKEIRGGDYVDYEEVKD
jgi:hypothetical protein